MAFATRIPVELRQRVADLYERSQDACPAVLECVQELQALYKEVDARWDPDRPSGRAGDGWELALYQHLGWKRWLGS